ncbi:MAG TPA: OmpA family protein, partial [Bacteroidales bacterium]|nr:OmpA family protein [Bacteroidales bacterium]
TDSEDKVPENVVIVARNKKTNTIAGVYRPNKYTGEYVLTLRPGAEYDLIYNVNGRQMVSTSIEPTKEDADKFTTEYDPVDLNPVVVQLYAYHDRVLFNSGEVAMTPSGNRAVDKIISLVDTTEAPMAITINYPPSHPLSGERFDVVKNELINSGVNEEDIVAQGKIPPYAEIIYGLDITEGKEEFLEIDLAATADTSRERVIVKNIFFEFDRFNIVPKYHENLNVLAEYMLNNTDAVIEIAGHTDALGSNEYNYLLSYRRAKSVKDYLVDKGVAPSSLITKKYGETDPIAANIKDGQDNPEGRQLNRRVEFSVLKQGTREELVIESIEKTGDAGDEMLAGDQTMEADGEGKFTIQIFALKNRRSIDYFDDLIGVEESIGDDGFYRYYVGRFDTRQEARAAMKNLRDMGYEPFIRELSFFE